MDPSLRPSGPSFATWSAATPNSPRPNQSRARKQASTFPELPPLPHMPDALSVSAQPRFSVRFPHGMRFPASTPYLHPAMVRILHAAATRCQARRQNKPKRGNRASTRLSKNLQTGRRYCSARLVGQLGKLRGDCQSPPEPATGQLRAGAALPKTGSCRQRRSRPRG